MYSMQGCVKLYGRTALETLVDSGGCPCWKVILVRFRHINYLLRVSKTLWFFAKISE